MPQRVSENDSSTTLAEIFELNLPVVQPGEEPLPTPRPSYEAQMRHAQFLLRAQPAGFHARRLAAMNPEPFHLP